jgi:hypothetical protein
MQLHLTQQEIYTTRLLVQALCLTNNDTLKVVTLVQEIMTELSEALSEEDKIIVITKMVCNLMKKNGS